MARTQLLSCSLWQQVTHESKKQINLTKQTLCMSQVVLFCSSKPRGIPPLAPLVYLSTAEEKAWQEILGEKQHFPQFFCPLKVAC